MKLGVCFLTFNSEDVIQTALRAATQVLRGCDHDIVVVDNASQDGTVAAVRESHPDIHIICNQDNLGYSAGNNIGARYLMSRECDGLLFVNPDVFLLDDTAPRLFQALTSTPDAGCAGGVAVDEQGRIWPGNFRKKPGFLDMIVLHGFSRYFPVTRALLAKTVERLLARHLIAADPSVSVQPVYAVSGACIMFPARSFHAIGGFDEHSFLFMEEFIVSEQLRRIGQRVIGVPTAGYLHEKSSTVRRYPLETNYYVLKSCLHLVRAYFHWPFWRIAIFAAIRWSEYALHALMRKSAALMRKPAALLSPGRRETVTR